MNYFINGRYIKSTIIHKAIEEAYSPYTMQHRYPFTVLHFTVPSDMIDINVHPQKMEIRFSDAQGIYQSVYQAISEVLKHKEFIPEVTFQEKKEKPPIEKRERQAESFEINRRKKDNGKSLDVLREIAEYHTRQNEKKGLDTLAGNTSATQHPASENVSRDLDQTSASGNAVQGQDQTSASENVVQERDSTFASGNAVQGQDHTSASENVVREQDHTSASENIAQERDSTSVSGNAVQQQDQTSASENVVQEQDQTSADEEYKPEKAQAEKTAEQIKEARQETIFEHGMPPEQRQKEIKIIGQVFDTFWILQFQEAMYMVDQHAAHEKVLYERFMKQLRGKEVMTQLCQPPVILTLSIQEEEVVMKHQEVFEQLGYQIEHFGGREYAVTGVPAHLPSIGNDELLKEVIDTLVEDHGARHSSGTEPEILMDRIATMSCKAAVKGNNRLPYEEMEELLKELMGLENPYHCPHGRPTMIKFTKTELDKKFKRIL